MRAIKGFGGVRKNKQACGLLVGLLSSWGWTSGGDCPHSEGLLLQTHGPFTIQSSLTDHQL